MIAECPPVMYIQVLCSDAHWSCLCIRNSDKDAAIADGKYRENHMELGRIAHQMLLARLRMAQEVDGVKFAQVPQQKDNWSCGPRLVTHTKAILQHWRDEGRLSSWSLSFDAAAISSILSFLSKQAEKFKKFGSFNFDTSSGSSEAQDVATSSGGTESKAVVTPHSCAPRLPPAAQHGSSSACPPAPPAGQQVPHQPVTPPSTIPKGQPSSALFDTGREAAINAGVDFDHVMQREHKRVGMPLKGHWRALCISVANALAGTEVAPLDCTACSKLQEIILQGTHQICAPEEVPEPPNMCTHQICPPCTEKPSLQLVQTSAKKGRRKKGDDTFRLSEWLEQNRSGQYEILPDTGNVPLRCRACDKIFSAVRTSTPHFVYHHEEGRTHIRSVAAVPLVDVDAEPHMDCTGVNLSKSPSDMLSLVRLLTDQ